MDCRGFADEGARARLNVCLREEKPFAVGVGTEGDGMDGDGGRIDRGGDVVPLRRGVEGLLLIFFLLNGLKNEDQSDSN